MKPNPQTKKRILVMMLALLLLAGAMFAVPSFVAPAFASKDSNARTADNSAGEVNARYDSVLFGNSKALAVPTGVLNEKFDASFYTIAPEGITIYDIEALLPKLAEEYVLRNVVLLLEPRDASAKEGNWKPDYLLRTVRDHMEDGLALETEWVWDDRDNERVGTEEEYLKTYDKQFAALKPIALPFSEEMAEALQSIRAYCAENDIAFQAILPPLSVYEMASYSEEDIDRFLTCMAGVGGYWCFLNSSSMNYDARFYYDSQHFRKDIAECMLARIFGEETRYVPEDFGYYVSPEKIDESVLLATVEKEPDREDYTANIPVIMYHAISEDSSETVQDSYISLERFELQIKALSEAGYESVTPNDIYAYVNEGAPLPEKPILITFDDGYTSSIELGGAILEKYGMSGTIFTIGVSVGKDTYKDTGKVITPHFGFEEALHWEEKGIITIGSHTYDMHQMTALDGEGCRIGVEQKKEESDEAYYEAVLKDAQKAQQFFTDNLGHPVKSFAYPHGRYTAGAETALHIAGFPITFTTMDGMNCLVKGLPQSLYLLRRNLVQNTWNAEGLLWNLENL